MCICYEARIPTQIPSDGQYAQVWTETLRYVSVVLDPGSQGPRLRPLSIARADRALAGQSGIISYKTR